MVPGTDKPSTSADALRDGLVDAGWRLVGLLERLDHGASRRLLADLLEAEAARAEATLAPLERWQGLGEVSYTTYLGAPNQVRIRRLLDLVMPGDRVVDIGIGFGYLTAVLVRTGLLEAYCGIDIEDRYVRSAHRALESHGLPTDHVHLETRSLYDVTPEWMAQHRPTLVTVLEVLEHLPDPGGALQTLAAAVGPGTEIVFTVPMLRRLEGVWGHASVFDRERITRLCADAGLVIQMVEPVHDVWMLVMASKAHSVPARLGRALAAREPGAPHPERGYTFDPIALAAAEPTRSATVEPAEDGVHVSVAARRRRVVGRGPIGGARFSVRAPEILRFQVAYDDGDAIAAVRLNAFDESGERVGSWKWNLTWRNRPGERPVTHVIRNSASGRFVRLGASQLERAAQVELSIELRRTSRRAGIRVLQAASVAAVAADKR